MPSLSSREYVWKGPKATPEQRLRNWLRRMSRAFATIKERNNVAHWPLHLQMPPRIQKANGFATHCVVMSTDGDIHLDCVGGAFLGNVTT